MPYIDFYYPGKNEAQDTLLFENRIGAILHGESDFYSDQGLQEIIQNARDEYFILFMKCELPNIGQYAFERMWQVAKDSGAGIIYADYYEMEKGKKIAHPLNDYQIGSLRDDFDFGPLLMIRTDVAKEILKSKKINFQYAALYDLRLKLSEKYPLIHLNEFLYTIKETDMQNSEEKMFAYVDSKNRAVQIEMEQACTEHLKFIHAWLPPVFEEIDLQNETFPVEVSVIIPVRNRVRTINDAIDSVLSQRTSFPYNLIIIDNYSTDGTSEAIAKRAVTDQRIIHIIPKRNDLGIGGCWNEGVQRQECGRFSVQLDSDDVYSDTDTLSKIVQTFYAQNCAMLVGSYRMCNFDLQTIPPGIIDHKEWTPENGRNNALRINGLGAPRAFYTPALREIKVPNTSYGEDYALGLQFSRHWKIGRIFDVLYLCRRWEDNSDSSLDITKLNNYNAYKDKLRSIELKARQNINN